MPKVSIAMATFNGGRFLEEQLQSFVDQTRPPDELVICDDGSTDDTVEISERFAAKAPFRVLVRRNERNLGYNANFSRAVTLCSGDVIFLSDQDDRWSSTKIERSLQAFGPGVEVVLNDQTVVHPDGTAGETMLQVKARLGFPEEYFVAGCCTSMSRAFAEIALPFPAEVPFDTWISRLAEALQVRRLVRESLQIYRRHDGTTTSSVFAGRRPSKLDVLARHSLASGREGWRSMIHMLELMEDRLRERRREAEQLVGKATVDEALAKLARQKEPYRRRLELVSLPRLRRAPAIVSFWRRGCYRPFSGWKSAVKDLVLN